MQNSSLLETPERVAEKAARFGRGPSKNLQARSHRRTLTVLVLPSVLLLVLINGYPLIYAAIQSLRDGSLIDSGNFVGGHNYSKVLTDPAFWKAVRFTVFFVIISVIGSWIVGLALAMFLRARIPGSGFFKVLLLLPWVVPIVVSATSWNFLLVTPQSPVPVVAQWLGFGNPLFIADPVLAKVTVCLFEIWVNFPFMMLMSSAALSSVDDSVYEAARMDGANARQQFTRITLPLIARSTFISWILMTIFIVNDFPTVYLLTGGGPVDSTTTLVILSYRTVFENFQVGPGVAIAFLMSLTLIIISSFLYRQVRKAHI